MTCRELASFIVDYLAGELPPERAGAFERHLELCANCRRYLEQYGQTIAAGQGAFTGPDAELPADVPDELVRAILAARQR